MAMPLQRWLSVDGIAFGLSTELDSRTRPASYKELPRALSGWRRGKTTRVMSSAITSAGALFGV